MYICNCIVHVSRYIILFLLSFFFLCFRALGTQQGGYVRATNLYYYYYYYYYYFQIFLSQYAILCSSSVSGYEVDVRKHVSVHGLAKQPIELLTLLN